MVLDCDFFLQAEDGIRDLVRSRGLGDVYKRQEYGSGPPAREIKGVTYHGLEIRRAGGGCEAVIIVDV